MDLPPGCSAAWFGDEDADWICYRAADRMAMLAVTHAAAHLSLLHCGRVRDGGRFICIDTNTAPRHLLHEFFMLVAEDPREWPSPLFAPDEESAADEAAATLLEKCGLWPGTSIPLQAASGPTFRCLG